MSLCVCVEKVSELINLPVTESEGKFTVTSMTNGIPKLWNSDILIIFGGTRREPKTFEISSIIITIGSSVSSVDVKSGSGSVR